MCEICHQTPCDCRCPNASEPIVGECEECGSDIRSDYEFWKDENENLFCSEECVFSFFGVTIVDGDE